MPRFAVLEHTGAPDDPSGRHFDLLVEAPQACRTWRLLALPQPGGGPVAALELPPHRLAWLDHVAGEVSGGRGFARRVDSGMCEVLSGDVHGIAGATACVLMMWGATMAGRLRLDPVGSGWSVRLE